MLLASGEMSGPMGGLPTFPEINMEVALQPRHIMGSVGPAYQADPRNQKSTAAGLHEAPRNIYIYIYIHIFINI